MRYAKLLAAVALLGTAGSALAQDYVRVERRRSTAGIILRDTVAGGVLGSAVAGGIILYEMGVNDNEDYNWERTLAWGAVIGLGAGLVFGIVDATDEPDYARLAPLAKAPVRDGLSTSLARRDQSGVQRFPLLVKRF
jgi:hypothetical protein